MIRVITPLYLLRIPYSRRGHSGKMACGVCLQEIVAQVLFWWTYFRGEEPREPTQNMRSVINGLAAGFSDSTECHFVKTMTNVEMHEAD